MTPPIQTPTLLRLEIGEQFRRIVGREASNDEMRQIFGWVVTGELTLPEFQSVLLASEEARRDGPIAWPLAYSGWN